MFGPHPRSYRAALPKRMKRQALRCVLSDKVRQDRLFCLDSTSTIDGKTKSMTQLLENLAVGGSALMVTMGTDRDVVLAASNIKKIWTLPVNQLNAQELLARDTVIMTVEAARWVEGTLANEPHGRRGSKWAISSENEEQGESVLESETEEETPKPRRRRASSNNPDVAGPDEGATNPRPRRRRAAVETAADEPAAEVPAASTESPAEEA